MPWGCCRAAARLWLVGPGCAPRCVWGQAALPSSRCLGPRRGSLPAGSDHPAVIPVQLEAALPRAGWCLPPQGALCRCFFGSRVALSAAAQSTAAAQLRLQWFLRHGTSISQQPARPTQTLFVQKTDVNKDPRTLTAPTFPADAPFRREIFWRFLGEPTTLGTGICRLTFCALRGEGEYPPVLLKLYTVAAQLP